MGFETRLLYDTKELADATLGDMIVGSVGRVKGLLGMKKNVISDSMV